MRGALAESDVVDVVVACGRAQHVIRWTGRELELLGHPGPRDDDDVLVALSGGPAKCRAIEEAWHRLDRVRGEELLTATPARLVIIARRLAATVEQRERVRVRDDLGEHQRDQMVGLFDQMVYGSEIAALGPALAARCAELAVGPRWRRLVRRSRQAR